MPERKGKLFARLKVKVERELDEKGEWSGDEGRGKEKLS
jgi:hypothetical protein